LVFGGQRSDRPFGRRVTGRFVPALRVRLLHAATLVAAVALFPAGVVGFSTPETSQEPVVLEDRSGLQGDGPCAQAFEDVLRTAKVLAEAGEPDSAATLLASALGQCPDHPELLADLAGLRILQGDLLEAEGLATRLVRIRPDSSYAWELLALTRYLQDDTRSALHAWNQVGRPLVHDVNIRVLGHSAPRDSEAGPDPDQVGGVARGQVLTVKALVRGERRLGALPAAAHARLGYRMVPGGEATVDGTLVLGAGNPFTRPDLVAHSLRLLGRRVHLVSADPFGRLERWELSGTMEGTLHKAEVALAHPAPGGRGVWRWKVDHETGRYGSAGLADAARETSTSLGWSHTDWTTSTLRGSVHSRVDVRPERGTFVGAGAGWTLLPATAQGAIGAEGTGWMRIGGNAPDDNGRGSETRYGRAEIRGVFHAMHPRAWDGRTDGNGVGLDMRGGIVAVSRGIPPDLVPRTGSGSNAALLMRGRSDLDEKGVVRPLFPGTAWAHGGIEVVRPMVAVGPVGLGVAVFADGVRVLAAERRPAVPADRRGAVHLGGGVRARIPGLDGWFRADWGIDPSDGTSTFSAAWVRQHRLHRLSAH
jgi:hypothetical protein